MSRLPQENVEVFVFKFKAFENLILLDLLEGNSLKTNEIFENFELIYHLFKANEERLRASDRSCELLSIVWAMTNRS